MRPLHAYLFQSEGYFSAHISSIVGGAVSVVKVCDDINQRYKYNGTNHGQTQSSRSNNNTETTSKNTTSPNIQSHDEARGWTRNEDIVIVTYQSMMHLRNTQMMAFGSNIYYSRMITLTYRTLQVDTLLQPRRCFYLPIIMML